uniref:Uncharacterized protein n=1 Tax=Anguilla anguilla TaxID=7936 RepID=A0A0E9WSJ3_ANGAN
MTLNCTTVLFTANIFFVSVFVIRTRNTLISEFTPICCTFLSPDF